MAEKRLLTPTNLLFGLVLLTLVAIFRFGLDVPHPHANCDEVGNSNVDVWALQARKVAADVWAWRTYQARLDQLANASHFSCSGPQTRLRLMDFSQMSPPAHYLPARGNVAHASVYAELSGRNSCDLVYPRSACDAMKNNATHWPDLWLQDFIDIALEGCTEEGTRCAALDIGSHVGLAGLRMLQNGAKVVSFEMQPDLCCAGYNSAKVNEFESRSTYLCGGIGVDAGWKDLANWDNNWDQQRLGPESGQGGMKMSEIYESMHVPTEVPVWKIQDIMVYPPQFYRFIKLDTDADCDLLRVLVDMQTMGDISFSGVSFKAFSGKCQEDAILNKLLSDLQRMGFDLYRAPNFYQQKVIHEGNGKSFYVAIDKFPDETEEHIPIHQTTLLKLRNMTLGEWSEASKRWKTTDYIIATNIRFLHYWPTHKDWSLQGRGCCWNGGELGRQKAVADIAVGLYWDEGLEACENLCLKHPDECSVISYFPRTGWCTAWAQTGRCPNTLRDQPGDCGSTGQEVLTYHYVGKAQPAVI